MGKHSSIIHKYFLKSLSLKKDQRQCKFCKWATTNNATRMLKHIINCVKCPQSVKDQLTLKTKTRPTITDDSSNTTKQLGLAAEATVLNLHVSTPTNHEGLRVPSRADSRSELQTRNSFYSMDSFCDKMSATEQVESDELLCRAIYASAAPLSMVENEYWLAFFKKLRPSYTPPSTYKVSNGFLDKEVERVRTFTNDLIDSAETLGLMCDGWTNVRNESIVNFVITTPAPVFYKSLATECNRHTGEYTAKCIIEVLKAIGPLKFFGIVTDNAANMKKAWQLVTNKYDHLIAYGCLAHGLSLLINDCLKLQSLVDLVNEGKKIVKDINNGHVLKAVFVEKQKHAGTCNISLKLPVVTRWGSVVAFLKSLLKNKAAIRAVNIDERCEKDLSANAKRSILSDVFWDKAQHLYLLLKPIALWITVIEADKPQMSLTCKIFSELSLSFEEHVKKAPCLKHEEQKLFDLLKLRKDFCLQDVHKAANMMDPYYRGEHLSSEDKVDAAAFICEVATKKDNIDEGTLMAELGQYQLKSGIFAKEYLWTAATKMEGYVWWNAFCSHVSLSKVASMILKLPATSAACERTFSTYKDVHSFKRNRLTTDRASNLVFVKHNLKLKLASKTVAESETPSRRLESTSKPGSHTDTLQLPQSEDESQDTETETPSTSMAAAGVVDIGLDEDEDLASESNLTSAEESEGEMEFDDHISLLSTDSADQDLSFESD